MNVDRILRVIKKFIPRGLFRRLQPVYHYILAFSGALFYRFPSRHLNVVAVTGTKGKTSTVELINAILERAGYRTALSSTVRFKIDTDSHPNTYKMSLPGRFFLQRFLQKAVKAGCRYAVIEMTSEGAKQFRHKFVSLDALVFTNISPEHIESHGSFENYLNAKLSIGKALAKSKKPNRVLVANRDDEHGSDFLSLPVPETRSFGEEDAKPYEIRKEGISLTWEKTPMTLHLSGMFNLYNALAAATYAKTQNISHHVIAEALSSFTSIPGRVERIIEDQDFTVIVDYAHTPDSLEKLYQVFDHTRLICVLGSTGGGRDRWKRPVMGRIAEAYCEDIILTEEDPYDEDPQHIVEEIIAGMRKKPTVIEDRREAIAEALARAGTGDAVLITGKGTDPYIMGPSDTKTPWSDAQVTREELRKILSKNQ